MPTPRPRAVLRPVASDLSSKSSSDHEDVLRMRLTFGGFWERQANDRFQYTGGETYLEKLPFDVKYADLMHIVNEKTNGATIFKYTPPGEIPGPNNLVTVLDDEHIQEMIEDYQMAVNSSESPGKRFRLLVWLSKAEEDIVTLEDIEMTKDMDWASETEPSEKSDGTHSPMVKASGWLHRKRSTEPSDVDVQMMVAQDACLYMNDMEEAEKWQALTHQASGWPASRVLPSRVESQKSLNSPLYFDSPGADSTGADPQDYAKALFRQNTVPRKIGLHYGSEFQTHTPGVRTPSPLTQASSREAGGQYSSPSSPMKSDSPKLQTPQHAQQANVHLPSNLGSSLGHGQTPAIQRSNFLRLPSKLGSSLGNAACGSLRTTSTMLPPIHHDDSDHQDISAAQIITSPPDLIQDSGRSTPNQQGASMDHFHVVPLSELTPIMKLGEGTFGEVLQCSNQLFGQIAVKCAKTQGDQELFSQEIHMLSSLNHPNVLRFFGVVTKDGPGSDIIGVMTEFMQGRSLSHYLGLDCPRLSLLERAKLARGAVNGLMYLHKHDIVHFDLKPENLLLDYPLSHGRHHLTPGIKVADFGLSKYKVNAYASTDSGLRGTVPYMAPEIVVDRQHVTEKADIWSLGMVFWEMYTHRVPYGNMPGAEIVARLRLGNAYPDIPSDMEQEWAELIDACCRSSPNDRFSLENIAAILNQIIQQESARSPASVAY